MTGARGGLQVRRAVSDWTSVAVKSLGESRSAEDKSLVSKYVSNSRTKTPWLGYQEAWLQVLSLPLICMTLGRPSPSVNEEAGSEDRILCGSFHPKGRIFLSPTHSWLALGGFGEKDTAVNVIPNPSCSSVRGQMNADIGVHPYREDASSLSLLATVCKKIPMYKNPMHI